MVDRFDYRIRDNPGGRLDNSTADDGGVIEDEIKGEYPNRPPRFLWSVAGDEQDAEAWAVKTVHHLNSSQYAINEEREKGREYDAGLLWTDGFQYGNLTGLSMLHHKMSTLTASGHNSENKNKESPFRSLPGNTKTRLFHSLNANWANY